jgi:hypothetical protein
MSDQSSPGRDADDEDALKDATVKSGTGNPEKAYDEQSDEKVTSGATEQNPETDDPEGTP